jgi:hypothetical protein
MNMLDSAQLKYVVTVYETCIVAQREAVISAKPIIVSLMAEPNSTHQKTDANVLLYSLPLFFSGLLRNHHVWEAPQQPWRRILGLMLTISRTRRGGTC